MRTFFFLLWPLVFKCTFQVQSRVRDGTLDVNGADVNRTEAWAFILLFNLLRHTHTTQPCMAWTVKTVKVGED